MPATSAIAFSGGFGPSPLSTTIDRGTGAGRASMALAFTSSGEANAITGCTIGGVAMTQIYNAPWSSDDNYAVFVLDDNTLPSGATSPSGSQTATLSWSGNASTVFLLVLSDVGFSGFRLNTYTNDFAAVSTTNPLFSALSNNFAIGDVLWHASSYEPPATSAGTPSAGAAIIANATLAGSSWRWAAVAKAVSSGAEQIGFSPAGSIFPVKHGIRLQPLGAAPTLSPPTAQTVTAPAAATFPGLAITGAGTAGPWQRQAGGSGAFVDVAGTSSTSALVTGATSASGGSWNHGDVVRGSATWAGGTVYSSVATLTVNAGVGTRTVTVRLFTDAAGTIPAVNIPGLKFSFHEAVSPDLFASAPFAKGANGATDSNGDFALAVTGTALAPNGTGYLVVDSTNGSPTQSGRRFFCGPVQVP